MLVFNPFYSFPTHRPGVDLYNSLTRSNGYNSGPLHPAAFEVEQRDSEFLPV